ncbi:MAG: hypothetical protein U9Q63_03230, partial [Patescibacteria group bacterium]|nr:hypothetical protein [Patescibacteria group bacterium]
IEVLGVDGELNIRQDLNVDDLMTAIEGQLDKEIETGDGLLENLNTLIYLIDKFDRSLENVLSAFSGSGDRGRMGIGSAIAGGLTGMSLSGLSQGGKVSGAFSLLEKLAGQIADNLKLDRATAEGVAKVLQAVVADITDKVKNVSEQEVLLALIKAKRVLELQKIQQNLTQKNAELRLDGKKITIEAQKEILKRAQEHMKRQSGELKDDLIEVSTAFDETQKIIESMCVVETQELEDQVKINKWLETISKEGGLTDVINVLARKCDDWGLYDTAQQLRRFALNKDGVVDVQWFRDNLFVLQTEEIKALKTDDQDQETKD